MKLVERKYTPITHFAAKCELYKHFMNRRIHDKHYNDTVWLKRGIHHAVGIPHDEAKANYLKCIRHNPDIDSKVADKDRPVYNVNVYEVDNEKE